MEPAYFPALGWFVSSQWYRFVCGISGLGYSFKKQIQDVVGLEGNEVMADVGCGEGTFIAALTEQYPHVRAHGFDPDPFLLREAASRVKTTNSRVTLEKAFAESLPRPSNYFDIAFFTFVLHHLTDIHKRKALKEAFRILKPKGKLVITDFGPPLQRMHWPHLYLFEDMRLLRGCLEGRVASMVTEAGFVVQSHRPFKADNITLLIATKE